MGSLLMHWSFTVLILLATWPLAPEDAYALLTGIYAYLFDAVFPAAIALGVLYLHCNPDEAWACKISGFNPTLNVVAALFVALAGLFPIVMQWIQPSEALPAAVPWFVLTTVASAVLGAGVIYWLGLRIAVPLFGSHQCKVLRFERDPHISREYGYPVLDHEVVRIRWVHKQYSGQGQLVEEGADNKRDTG